MSGRSSLFAVGCDGRSWHLHIRSSDSSRPDKNLRRMRVAILALWAVLAYVIERAGLRCEKAYKTPRPRMTMTVALACLVILTPQSMGMGMSACRYFVRGKVLKGG